MVAPKIDIDDFCVTLGLQILPQVTLETIEETMLTCIHVLECEGDKRIEIFFSGLEIDKELKRDFIQFALLGLASLKLNKEIREDM